MDIKLEKKNATEASIKIKLIQKDYQHKVEEKVKDYAKKANIKGFRPGKVPIGLIKKMYGSSILVEEVNHILSHSVNDYVKENNLNIIGQPLPNHENAEKIDWDTQTEFEFDFEIGLIDEFKYDLSKKQKVKKYTIEVDKKTVEETVTNLKKQFGKSINPEVSEDEDSLFGTFTQLEGEISNDTLVEISTVEKKAQKNFIGVKKDDVIEFEINKIFKDASIIVSLLNISEEEAKSLKGKFTFTVKNINRVEPSEINQELFDKVFGKDAVKSEDEFIEKIKDTVSGNYSRETDFYLENSIKDHFVDKTKIEVPSAFLKKWLLVTNEGKLTAEDVDKEFDATVKSLKWDLIKNKIAEDNELKVDNQEVVDKAKSMIMEQFGGAAMAEQMADKMDEFADNYLKGNNGDNYMQVFQQVHSEKITNYIKENITLNDKKVSVDEFQKIVLN
ncbi:MAG: trigger factor [Cyclobacteriaceae bacterium]|nr:trigger factor [Cyclobacteriaceae bacterium]